MKKFILLASIFVSLLVKAQDQTVSQLKNESDKTIKKDPKDTINQVWKKGGIFSLNLSQGSLSNWAAGGDEFSLSLNAILSAYAFYKKDKHSWDNTVDINFGFLRTTSLGIVKMMTVLIFGANMAMPFPRNGMQPLYLISEPSLPTVTLIQALIKPFRLHFYPLPIFF